MLLAVLTISDRCSQGLLTDTAGPAVVALLKQHWPEAEIRTGLLADDEDNIAATLEELSRQRAALVLTVGARAWAHATARRRPRGE
jgi:molybdopterin biosynthesis enzyme MoaB